MKFVRKHGLALLLSSALTLLAHAQEERHGRKYKAPPATSHIEVTVVKAANGKPISNAAVVFRSVKDGKDEGNLEVKTDPEGKATIDVIPTGSDLRVQVIAGGFATFGQNYKVEDATMEIPIAMARPKPQVSTYTDKIDERKPGVQEPVRPSAAKPPVATPPANTSTPSTPPLL